MDRNGVSHRASTSGGAQRLGKKTAGRTDNDSPRPGGTNERILEALSVKWQEFKLTQKNGLRECDSNLHAGYSISAALIFRTMESRAWPGFVINTFSCLARTSVSRPFSKRVFSASDKNTHQNAIPSKSATPRKKGPPQYWTASSASKRKGFVKIARLKLDAGGRQRKQEGALRLLRAVYGRKNLLNEKDSGVRVQEKTPSEVREPST